MLMFLIISLCLFRFSFGFKAKSIKEAINYLEETRNYEKLELLRVRPSLAQVESLALAFKVSNVIWLRLHDCGIGDIEVARFVKVILSENTLPQIGIKKLDFTMGNIGDEGARILAAAFETGKFAVSELILRHNYIRNAGISAIGASIKKARLLVTLDLSMNFFDDKGIQDLAQGLLGSSIKYLDLSSNGEIRDEGVIHLAKAIGEPTWSLRTLNLAQTSMRDIGAKALADILSSTHLKKLILNENKIGSRGARFLADKIPSSNLQELHIRDNGIREESAKALLEALHRSVLLKCDASSTIYSPNCMEDGAESREMRNDQVYGNCFDITLNGNITSLFFSSTPLIHRNLNHHYLFDLLEEALERRDLDEMRRIMEMPGLQNHVGLVQGYYRQKLAVLSLEDPVLDWLYRPAAGRFYRKAKESWDKKLNK